MSVSRMFCAISPAAAPVVSAGSITSILSHWPQASVPPFRGLALGFASGAAPGAQAKTATLAAASADRRKNSRRRISFRPSTPLPPALIRLLRLVRLDRRVEDVQAGVEPLVADRQRHERPDDVAVEPGPQREQAALAGRLRDRVDELRGRSLRGLIAHELDRLHRADAADLTDARIARGHRDEALPDGLTDHLGAREQAVALDHGDRRERGRARDGVAPERRTELTGLERIHQL